MTTKRGPLLAGAPRCPAPHSRASLDLVNNNGAVARLWPTPARADQALALSDAFGEGFGCGAHRAIAFEVGFVFGAEALDEVVAGGGVARIVENERIAEDAVFAVDVDGDFAGAGLAGGAGALVAEADGTGGGGFHGECSLNSAWRVASPYRLPGGELGVRGGKAARGSIGWAAALGEPISSSGPEREAARKARFSLGEIGGTVRRPCRSSWGLAGEGGGTPSFPQRQRS